MSITTSVGDQNTCFKLKTSFAPCTILQLTDYKLEVLEHQLAKAISRAPNFFLGSPVVIDLERIKPSAEVDFVKLKQVLITAGLVPMGVRGLTPELGKAAATAGLPTVTIGKLASDEKIKSKQSSDPQVAKIVDNPIRSGMQVYAKGSDLIVMAQVSAGSELLADGHIHVYGTLRGRALAGVQGNMQARIFCRKLEAELVSIAGYYLTREDIQTIPSHNGMIQIYLEKEQVKIESV